MQEKKKRHYTMVNRKPKNDFDEPVPDKYYRLWGEPFTIHVPHRTADLKTDGGGFN